MAKQKVKLAFIVDAAARKAAYKKRSKSILKKANELSTLCGIEACAIVYGPYEPEPEIWPSSPREVQKVVSKFRTKPEFEQSKKKLSQVDYLNQRIVKGDEQLKKLRKENRENEMKMLMYECLKGQIVLDNISMNDLNDLSWCIDHNLKDIGRKLDGNGEMAMMMNHGHVGMLGSISLDPSLGPNHPSLQQYYQMGGNGGTMFTSQQGLNLIPTSTMSNASAVVASNNWPQSFINNGTLGTTFIPGGNSDRNDSGASGSGNGGAGAGGYAALTPNQWSDLSGFNSPQ